VNAVSFCDVRGYLSRSTPNFMFSILWLASGVTALLANAGTATGATLLMMVGGLIGAVTFLVIFGLNISRNDNARQGFVAQNSIRKGLAQ